MSKNINGIKGNDVFIAQITDMTNTGAGVARVNGVVAFIDGAADGDTVEARVTRVANGYLICRTVNIITPSSHRITPDCPVFGRCGGCSYRHISYEHELELKRGYVESAFKKQGLNVNIMPVINEGSPDFWRNKVQIPVRKDGIAGYYANYSHDIVPCDRCRLHLDGFNEIIEFICGCIKKYHITGTRHICLRGGSGGIIICIVAACNDPVFNKIGCEIINRFGTVRGVLLNINAADTNVIYGEHFITLTGDNYIEDEMLGLRFKISMQSFYQVNNAAASLAYQKLYELSGVRRGDRILDMYCGAGTIGLYFMSRGKASSLTGVEIIPEAVENARANASLNGIENAEFVCADAGENDINRYGTDVIIVDPPRKGLSIKTVESIISSSAGRVAYMSCDPDTLARDCAIFSRNGFTISEIYPVDMFPRTGHVETVVLMTRNI